MLSQELFGEGPLQGMHVRLAKSEDVDLISNLEAISYPDDEAASRDSIAMRITNANQYFLVLEQNQSLIAFINGTCVSTKDFHHDSMTTHCESGKFLVIHSVTVSKELHRKQIGTEFLKAYVDFMLTHHNNIESIYLLTKVHLIAFYTSVGFSFRRLSSIVHGQVCTSYYISNVIMLC
jgi:N-acetylglutamate synthase-like GNAT family acetyltransferase